MQRCKVIDIGHSPSDSPIRHPSFDFELRLASCSRSSCVYFCPNSVFFCDSKFDSCYAGKDYPARNLSAAHPKTNLVIRRVFCLELGATVVTSIVCLVCSTSCWNLNNEHAPIRVAGQQHTLNSDSRQVRAHVALDQLLKSFWGQSGWSTFDAACDSWF